MARDDFKKNVKVLAYQRVAGRCSNPDCRVQTFAPSGTLAVSNVGVGAHIHAAAPGGPRYLESMTTHERSGFENIIWLCQNCATMIDRDSALYSPNLLRKWKSSAEASATMEQGKRQNDIKDIYRMAAMAMGHKATEFYPQAIQNVHEAVAQQLQAIDSRFNVSSKFINGQTSIALGAKERIAISIKVKPEQADVWREGLRRVYDEGCATTLPLDGVQFEGSEIFNVLSSGIECGALTIIPESRRAVVKMISANSSPLIFEAIDGQLTAGRDKIKFTGRCYGELLEVEISFNKTSEDGVVATSSLNMNLHSLNGKSAINPPYLDSFINLLTTIASPHAKISFVLEVDGSEVSSGNFHNPNNLDLISENISLALYIRRARDVLRHLRKNVAIDLSIAYSTEDHRALARFCDILEGKKNYKRSDVRGEPELTFFCSDHGEMLTAAINAGGYSSLQLKEPASPILVYGINYDAPSITTYYSPVQLKIASKRKRKGGTQFRVKMEMAENFTSQTSFDDIDINE